MVWFSLTVITGDRTAFFMKFAGMGAVVGFEKGLGALLIRVFTIEAYVNEAHVETEI